MLDIVKSEYRETDKYYICNRCGIKLAKSPNDIVEHLGLHGKHSALKVSEQRNPRYFTRVVEDIRYEPCSICVKDGVIAFFPSSRMLKFHMRRMHGGG